MKQHRFHLWRFNQRHIVFVAAAAMIVLGTPDASAQPSTEAKAIAESLFREARDLMNQERYPEACRKFEESNRLDPALGTLLNMAVCHEKEGRIATAWAEFNEAMVMARREGRYERVEFARERVAAIEPNLPRLNIIVTPEARVDGLEILRNGTPIGSGAWGTALPVDPGDVTIEARAPKYKPWSTSLIIALTEKQSVEVPVLELAPEPPKQPDTGVGGTFDIAPLPEEFWTTSRIAGVTLAGIGVATIAVGGFFGATALSKKTDSDKYCSGTTCTDQQGVDLSKDAVRNANVANITMGAGALVGAVGALLILTGGSSEPAKPSEPGVDLSFTLSPWGADGTSAGVRGTW